MSAVRGTRLGERQTWWQYHIASAFGGMSVCGYGWWRDESKCRYLVPQGHPIMATGQPCSVIHVTCPTSPSLSTPNSTKTKASAWPLLRFLEDAQRCSLLYDVIHEIYTTELSLNLLRMPPHTSCFRLLTLLSPLSLGLYPLQ